MIERFTHFKNSWWWGSRGKHISVISCTFTALSVRVLLFFTVPAGENGSRQRLALVWVPGSDKRVRAEPGKPTAFSADPQPLGQATAPPGPPPSLAVFIPLVSTEVSSVAPDSSLLATLLPLLLESPTVQTDIV